MVLISMPLIIWVIPGTLGSLGWSWNEISLVLFPLMAAWLLIGGIRSLLLSCPKCGKSLYLRGMISVPWPEKICSKCGTNLTIATK